MACYSCVIIILGDFMEKRKRWQFILILAVIGLTLYNILPTLFFYANPLRKPIGEKEANKVALQIVDRVNSLEEFSIDWIKAEAKNLKVKLKSVSLDKTNPRLIHVSFEKPEDATFFGQTLRRAGALIPFAPAELSPDPRSFEEGKTEGAVLRKIGIHLDPQKANSYFHFIPKYNQQGELTPEYRKLVDERTAELLIGFGESAPVIDNDDSVLRLARTIVDYDTSFGQGTLTHRYFSTINTSASDLSARFNKLSSELTQKIESKGAQSEQEISILKNQKNSVDTANAIVSRSADLFRQEDRSLNRDRLMTGLEQGYAPQEALQVISLNDRNPFISAVAIDWKNEKIELLLHKDVLELQTIKTDDEIASRRAEKLNQLLYNEIARVARQSDETISPHLNSFSVSLSELTNATGFLALDLAGVAEEQVSTLVSLFQSAWKRSGELSSQDFPILATGSNPQDTSLGLVFVSPLLDKKLDPAFRKSSLYIVGKGLGAMVKKYRDSAEGPEKSSFDSSMRNLAELMHQNGFIGYYGRDFAKGYENDFIFELDDFNSYLIAATRENFSVKGNRKMALLEFTDVEQRILAINKIETAEQEDLLQWKDDYEAARVSVDPQMRYDVPAPTKNTFLNNLRLSTVKYFRGDDRKIIRWGLDLSGGKTVRIGLKDQNNHSISNEDDIKQAINELYARVNKLGVSEVGIRQEGEGIVLDFPGSQNLSARDLVRASSMAFHVVNEKFTPSNPALREAVSTFLDEVWNEAVITNRKDPESINQIAWQHLGGTPENEEEFHPVTPHAKLLYDNGLRLAGPRTSKKSSAFNDTLSQVAQFRGHDYLSWQGQTYPLLIVFNNFALEGSNLTDIQTGYDPSEGNVLSFAVKGSSLREGEKISPRDDFFAWTSQFSEEKVAGTPKETYSQGRGWRMAVILNGSIVSSPSLNAPLRDSARITGHFSQREINQLAADLKAGSLSFTPQILSEENVSPDLGKEQRTQGVGAALLGLVLVVATMCIYYRFGGVVASIAVIFNLFIIWAVLQNLGAAITLPGIAGIILTMGMSVDANVLVFERIREEFAISKRLGPAIAAGYRKAFSAIVDSNLTTIIAALILLNFDSGPIKGFALTLIIGIISSMFTSLFMTRYFFAGWVQNPKHKELKMMRLFNQTHFNFLGWAKTAILSSAVIIVFGLYFLVSQKQTIFGMDFTGGYALTVDLKQEAADTAYRVKAEKALLNAGASSHNFQIRELNTPNRLRIQLGMGMEQKGKPFNGMAPTSTVENPLFAYQTNPRIVWIVQALERDGLQLEPSSLPSLNLQWSEMSGQLSVAMRNQALFGLGLALLAILIYITFRFEFKYAISATLGLAHDLLITMGILAIIHLFYGGLQIDLQVIGALMTIVGYSLNDTIIIFDRIREDIKGMRKHSFKEIVNHALNATLSRTVMTSGTTLVVLLALVAIGGSSIFNFALIMTIGVAVGTLSSLFVAAPLLLYFHGREVSKHESDVVKAQ